MRWLRQSRGFTLVELVIVLGIIALATAAALVGQGALRQDAAFKGAVDGVKNQLRQVQNEAVQAISSNQSSATGQTSTVIFGKVVQFSPSAPDNKLMKTWTLVGTRQDGIVTGLAKCNEVDTTIENGMVYNGAQSRSVVFTRQPESLYVAPIGATEVATASGVCDSTTSDTADQLSNLAADGSPGSPCSGGASYERPDGNAVGLCRNQPPAQPTIAAYDSNNTLIGGSTTNSTYVDIKITSQGDAWELWVDGAKYQGGPASSGGPSLSTAIRYTFPDNSAHTFYAYSYSGNSAASPRSNTLTINKNQNNSCSSSGSTSLGYVCGLEGEYFRGSGFSGSAQTRVIDTNVGASLGNGESSYNNFLPTLRKRTGQRFSQNDSVRWTGDFYADAGVTQLCVSPSGGGTATLSTSTQSTSGTNFRCVTVTSGVWTSFTLKYSRSNVGTFSEGVASIILTGASGSPLSSSKLRVHYASSRFNDGNSVTGPPFTIGLTGQYYNGCVYATNACKANYTYQSLEYWNGVGSDTSTTPVTTYPNWGSYLFNKSGNNGSQGMSALWFGYLYIPVSGTYSFATQTDDAGGFWMNGPSGSNWLVWDQTGWQAPTWRYSSTIYLTAGQYQVQLHNEDDCQCGVNNTTYEIAYSYNGGGYTEIPNQWFSYYYYYAAENTLPTFRMQDIAETIKGDGSEGTVPTKTPTVASLGRSLASLLLPQHVLAVGSCDTNILNPYNYLNDCASFINGDDGVAGHDVSLPFQLEGDTSRTANLIFNHSSKTVSRSIP